VCVLLETSVEQQSVGCLQPLPTGTSESEEIEHENQNNNLSLFILEALLVMMEIFEIPLSSSKLIKFGPFCSPFCSIGK
jgi:hypothetical protein